MNSLNDIWNIILESLSSQLTPTAIKTWFDDCRPAEIEKNRLILISPNAFKRGIIESRFSSVIKSSLYEIFASDMEFTVMTEEEYKDYKFGEEAENELPELEGYTFDSFVVGPTNVYAHSAALAVSENPGNNTYNPLFIYGNSGLGKTHLLKAIGQAIHKKNPDFKITYVKGNDFTDELVVSIREGNTEKFRSKYRGSDLFLMDDIQFIAGKQQTQIEFFHTFNEIIEAGHQIVVTSDRPPIEMATLDDRLRSRFEGSLMADIQPPDIETRMAIIKNKAAQLGLILSDESVQYIAENITSNVRQLEGVIKRLTAYKEIMKEVITPEYVKRAIKDVIRDDKYVPTPDTIINETARFYSLTADDLKGQNRSKNTAMARQISMYLMRTLTNLPLKDIGTHYEDRSHATVLSSIRKVEDLMKTDKQIRETVRDITSNITSNAPGN